MNNSRKSLNTATAACLTANVVILRLFSAEPNFFTGYSLTAAAIFFAGAFLIFLLWWGAVMKLVPYENSDILRLMENRYGRIAKSVLAFPFALYFSMAFVVSIQNISSIAPSGSNIPAGVASAFVLIAIALSYIGTSLPGKIHFYATCAAIVLIILLFVCSGRLININNMFPVFGNGYKSMIFGLPRALSLFSGFAVILFIIPFSVKRKDMIFCFWTSVFIIVAVGIAFLYLLTLTLPKSVLLTTATPVLELIKTLPPALSAAISWALLLLSLVYVSTVLYFASMILSVAVNVPAKYINLPLGAALWLFTVFKTNSPVIGWMFTLLWDYGWLFGFVIPLIAAIMLKLKGGKSDACL